MYQFKSGPEMDPELTAQEPKQHLRIQDNRNPSKVSITFSHSFFRKIAATTNTAIALPIACLVALLSGCGGLTLNSNFLTKGSASASTGGTLSKISCGTQSLTGAQSKECSVYLSAPATSSTSVALSSSNAALKVPASVTVAAGASNVGFTAASASVTKSVSVTMTGKADGVITTDVITLYPAAATTPSLTMVSCGTLTIIGPITKLCSVYLSAAATSQTVVSLSSNNGALTVPKSVMVLAGMKTGGFVVIATAVSTTQSATLTAAADGVSQTAVFQLEGSGTTGSVQHHVQLSWDAPSSTRVALAGYRVYRMQAGGSSSYQLLNSSIDVNTSYTDSAVQSGLTYDYVVKSVDDAGVESTPSNVTSVTIP